jgi:hypothetical protein
MPHGVVDLLGRFDSAASQTWGRLTDVVASIKRILYAVACAFPIVSPISDAQAAAPAAKAFKADLAGLVVLPSGRAPDDADKEFHEHGQILRAPLGVDSVGVLAEPLTFDMYGKSVTIGAGQLLTSATARGGDLDAFPADRVVLCAASEANFAKQLAAASTLLLPTLFSRFQPWTQVCLMDADRDGAVDHAFMIGTRMPEDRHSFPIKPVRYVIRRDLPLKNSYLALTFYDPQIFIGARIQAEVIYAGGGVNIDNIYLGPKKQKAKILFTLKASQLPQTVQIAGAQIVVDSLSADLKTITARYVRDVDTQLFDFTVQRTIIYM